MVAERPEDSPSAAGPAGPAQRATIRARCRAARLAITGERAGALAVAAADRAIAALDGCRHVALYRASDGELDTGPLVSALAERGCRTYLPVLDHERLLFAPWVTGEPLVPNRFGIGEPTGPRREVGELDALVLPFVAVDPTGTRLGRGGGWYDRTLESSRVRGHAIGLGYDEQVVARIERMGWDVPLDLIVTPTRTIEASG